MARTVAATALGFGLLCTRAGAQIDPDDTGEGTKLGLAQVGNSGQVGTVTLFDRPPGRTLVLLRVMSVPPGRTESARIRRTRSCRAAGVGTSTFALALARGGSSRSLVGVAFGRLLSGNYVLEVFERDRGRRVSCGELHR